MWNTEAFTHTARSVEFAEGVFRFADEDRTASVRAITNQIGSSTATSLQVLHEQLLYHGTMHKQYKFKS